MPANVCGRRLKAAGAKAVIVLRIRLTERWVVMQRSGAEPGSLESGLKHLRQRLQKVWSRKVNTPSGLWL